MTIVHAIDTVQDLLDFYENLLDDAPDQDFSLQQLTLAKERIEDENELLVCRNEDSSKTATLGQNFSTLIDLPERWKKTLYLRIGTTEYFPCSFARRREGLARKYFIDYQQFKYGFSGAIGQSGTIYHGYLSLSDAMTSANLTSDLATLIDWPKRFAAIIAYEAAGFYQTGIDVDEISARQGPVNVQRAATLMEAFIAWDQDLKLNEMGNQLGYAPDVDDGQNGAIDVGSM